MTEVGCGDAPKGHPNPDAWRRQNPPSTPGRWSFTPKQWVIDQMDAWHNGPFGGQCPSAGTPEECSRYGVSAVQRWGAVIGVLAAARQVALCKPYKENPGDPAPFCGPADPSKPATNPRRWDRLGLMFVPVLVGLHLREAFPKPQKGSSPCAGIGSYLTLMRVGDESYKNNPCVMIAVMQVLAMFARLALLRQPGRQGPPSDPNRDGCGPG